jgi:hypothetical protein
MCREGLSLIHRTPTYHKIPADFQEKLLNLQRYVIQLKTKRELRVSEHRSADELAVYFYVR